MQLIEPCCSQKQLLALRSKLGVNGTSFFHGYGDLSLAELLPPMMTRYSDTDMMIVAPFLPDTAAVVLRQWMRKKWASADGKSKINVIGHMTLITDRRESKSPLASKWAAEGTFGSRMTLCDVQQNDTAILLPDIAFFGNINLSYGGHFTAVATKNAKLISDMRSNYEGLRK